MKKATLSVPLVVCAIAICTTSGVKAFAAGLPTAGSGILAPQEAGLPALEPKAEVEGRVYNFGTVLSGSTVKHVFTIRNAGKAPLKIESVNTSCGCTAAKPSKETLAPGEVSAISASIDTRFESGHSLSVVTVTTNDPHDRLIRLKMVGNIKPQVTARPRDIDFGKIRHGTAASRYVTISDMMGGKGFEIKSVKNASPYIKVTESPRRDGKPGAILHVALSPKMPPGPIGDTIRIETSRAPLRVAILGTVTGDLTVEPAQVSFGILPHHQSAVRILRLTNRSSHPVKVLGVKSSNQSVTAKVEPVTPGKEYKVTLAVRPNTSDGQIRGALTIHTDDPRQKELTVPFYGIIGSFKG